MINHKCLSRAPVMTKSKQMLLILHKAVVNQHTRHRWLIIVRRWAKTSSLRVHIYWNSMGKSTELTSTAR